MNYKVKDLETNKLMDWTLADILSEINRDRSSEWQDYDKKDWLEGWHEWIEGDYYTLITLSKHTSN